MKILSERFIKKEDIQFLKKGRRHRVRNRIIDYNGNFIEHMSAEKMISIVPRDDEILKLIDEHLVPALICNWPDEKWRPCNYDFSALPRKLKRYMKEMDEILYNVRYKEFSRGVHLDDYDSRITRLELLIPDYTDEQFKDFVLLGKPLPTPLRKKAKDSARRAYKEVNGLLKANVNKFTHFVTLTFAPETNRDKHLALNRNRSSGEYNLEFEYVEGSDFEIAKKRFSVSMDNFARKLRKAGYEFEYLAVWELQGNGAYHFHLLTTAIPNSEHYKVPSWLDYDHRTDNFERGYGLKFWNYGKSDIQNISNHARISTYVSKYILKSFYNVQEHTYDQYTGKRKYFPSRGLVRPLQRYLDDDEVEKTLAEFDLDNIEPFEKQYFNAYNDGLIKNNLYTLIKEKAAAVGTDND